MKLMRTTSSIIFSITVFLANLIPIAGPSMVSGILGYNEKRWKKKYGMTRKSLILAILIGHILFFFIAGITINFCADFFKQRFFWLIILSGFFTNIIFSIIFYFIGFMRYKKRK